MLQCVWLMLQEAGETDCWPVSCPALAADCPRVVQDDGDCCPRCDRDRLVACFTNSSRRSSPLDVALETACYLRGRLVPAYHSWQPDTADPCTTCQCLVRITCVFYLCILVIAEFSQSLGLLLDAVSDLFTSRSTSTPS